MECGSGKGSLFILETNLTDLDHIYVRPLFVPFRPV